MLTRPACGNLCHITLIEERKFSREKKVANFIDMIVILGGLFHNLGK